MKAIRYILGLSVIAAMSACSNDELNEAVNQPVNNQANAITLSTTLQGATTRGLNSNLQSTQIEAGTVVGVFVMNGSSAIQDSEGTNTGANNAHTADGNGGLTTETAMTWPEGVNSLTIAAYAPRQAGWSYNNPNRFTVKSDQSTDANYVASDLIYGVPAFNPVAKTSETIALNFAHKLAKVNFTINAADGVSLANATVTINNTVPSTLVSIKNGGELTADEGAAVTDIKAATLTSTANTASAIIVPQTVEAGTQFVSIEAGSKVIAKLPNAITFESGKVYNFAVTVNSLEPGGEPVVEGQIKLVSTSITDWGSGGDTDLGNAEPVVVVNNIGKFVTTDGQILSASEAATATNLAAVIFSNTVSSADAAAGYNAYAMALTRYKNRTLVADADHPEKMTNGAGTWSQGLNDLDGRTNTATMLASDYYAARTDEEKAACIFNLSGYTPAVSGTNVSEWFLPSFGQMVQILNAFAGQSITADFIADGDNIASGSAFYTSADGAAATLVSNFQTSVTQAEASLFAVGNIVYATSTENSSTSSAHRGKFWNISIAGNADSNTWSMGKNTGRGNNGRSVIPVIAVKVPTE